MKKILSTLLKIGVSVALFWWLSRYVNAKELLSFYHSLSLPLILAVLGLGILNIAGQAARFFYTASKLMPPFTFKQAVIAHFSGFTFRLALPASIGEVGKTFLLPGTMKQRIYTFLIDAFYCTGTMFFFFGISTYLLFPKMWYILGFCVIFVVFFWIYQLLKKYTGFGDYVLKNVPYFKIGSFNIIVTLFTYVTFISQYWLILRSYGISWFDQAKVSFFILGVGSIPVSFAGLGFRETAAHFALQEYGVPSSVAVGTAFFIFFVNVFIPAVAGIILLTFFSDIKFKHIRELIKKKEVKPKRER